VRRPTPNVKDAVRVRDTDGSRRGLIQPFFFAFFFSFFIDVPLDIDRAS
jgi:hypothetical protein